MSPGNDQSGKKRRQAKTTKGSQWLRTHVGPSGLGGQSHQEHQAGPAQYRRQSPRLGKKKVLIGLGHKILVLVYRILKEGMVYQELQARPGPRS